MKLIVTFVSRPWWMLGLVERHERVTMEPPPGTEGHEVVKLADAFREAGVNARIED